MIEQSFEESDLFFFVSTRSWVLNTWRSWFRVSSLSSSNVGESFTGSSGNVHLPRKRGIKFAAAKSVQTNLYIQLIGGLELFFIFSIQLGIIIPTDFHIFQYFWNHQPDKHGFSKQFAPEWPIIAILMSLMKMIKHEISGYPYESPKNMGTEVLRKAWFDTAERCVSPMVNREICCVMRRKRHENAALLKSNANLTLEHNVR